MAKKVGHGLGPTRARVLNRLAEFDGGIGVSALGADLGLHINTVRFHLEALVEAGYVTRTLEPTRRQGRPRALYHATDTAPVIDSTQLRDLTQVLVRQLVHKADNPQRVAELAGRGWGEELAASPATIPATARDGLGDLLDHTSAMGFAVGTPTRDTITFRSCPYRSVSQPTLASICTLHLGMMRGYLDAADSDLEVTSLTPGDVCVARLTRRPALGAAGG
ncbi:helix-turn-helix domain-containing protein [Tessaracoccus sp. OS52]|uniref:helix-turn-helix transcriptional regulator n=1 Tax=Tessaracoccus sp. OS52 TaxID=2886691 RepID=UPI001D11CB61|nr:helix-turn-helix domain-containing protein [Tessaracoccus sp. OS52]MCC2593726.1 helix-turn-helix domain-containing protein [Tessaracoccus sp. OS52]